MPEFFNLIFFLYFCVKIFVLWLCHYLTLLKQQYVVLQPLETID